MVATAPQKTICTKEGYWTQYIIDKRDDIAAVTEKNLLDTVWSNVFPTDHWTWKWSYCETFLTETRCWRHVWKKKSTVLAAKGRDPHEIFLSLKNCVGWCRDTNLSLPKKSPEWMKICRHRKRVWVMLPWTENIYWCSCSDYTVGGHVYNTYVEKTSGTSYLEGNTVSTDNLYILGYCGAICVQLSYWARSVQ